MYYFICGFGKRNENIFLRRITKKLHSKDKLSRKVFIQPTPENLKIFGLQDGELFELVRPLYGLCDASDYWGHTIEEHLLNDIGMTPLVTDAALFVKL